MERTNYSRLFLLWMITTFLYGAGIFLIGFFPINSYSLEHDKLEGRPQYLDDIKLVPPSQLYAQTILLLVDALREDFPTPTTMPFSYNNACSHLKLRVNIPTVTMPRLKSLTTGTISNFIDIVLNIGHVEQLSDSLLHRLHERNDTAVFAGDRTWQSLFPKQFKRITANTDSFFVNDFYEGDKNITAVLTKELEQSDWMLLVLHYLGLDHIGHVEGTESTKIPMKLKEMDDVVLQIYKAKHLQNQLLLLTGDHGMKDGGGHGGSTTAEMHVPLFVYNGNCISKGYGSKTYNQIDLAPTLAILWSIEIPPMSIGCLISELLLEYSLEDQLYAYYYNAVHLMQKANRKYGSEFVNASPLTKWFTAAKSAHKQFLLTKQNDNFDNAFFFENARVHYLSLSKDISSKLSDSLVQFDYGLITIGLTLTTMVVLHTLTVFYVKNQRSFINDKVVCLSTIVIALCTYQYCHYQGYITNVGIGSILPLLLAIAMNIYLMMNIANILWAQFYNFNNVKLKQLLLPNQIWLLLACLVFHTLSLASSSFIEEENQTWHYLGASALILLSVQNFCADLCASRTALCYEDIKNTAFQKDLIQTFLKSCSKWLLIGGLIFLERLHNFAFYINKEDAKLWLSSFFGAGLILLPLCLRQETFIQTRIEFLFYTITVILVYCYRASVGTVLFVIDTSCCVSIFLKMFWIVLGITTFISLTSVIINAKSRIGHKSSINTVANCFKVLLNSLLTISVLLHKPHNAILVTYLICILTMCYRMCDKLDNKIILNHKHLQKLLYTIIIGNMFYFYQGNSNSFATIDLNPGYIGQSTYNPLIVGILVTLNMYSAQFIAFLFLVTHIMQQNNGGTNKTKDLYLNEQIHFILYFYTLAIFVPVLIYFFLLLLFRYHLFIYSVFSPKALYEYYSIIVLFLTILLTTINFYIFGL